MRIVIHETSDTPLILDHVTRIEEELEGDTVIIYDQQEGRLEFQIDDIERFEGAGTSHD